ncbi:hypothetical protein N801_17110 [Knoellia aerolata DSM 18566]|uniref:Uncharacterized protein n=1 Tax=Knoellia aerolata DSM 18566 TaxID=1385519 RepID=A0A0A0JY35_9MICO|nr:hypothetical protein N801_17110 [Knoellia aerolata DSM 18566]
MNAPPWASWLLLAESAVETKNCVFEVYFGVARRVMMAEAAKTPKATAMRVRQRRLTIWT